MEGYMEERTGGQKDRWKEGQINRMVPHWRMDDGRWLKMLIRRRIAILTDVCYVAIGLSLFYAVGPLLLRTM